MTNSQTIVLINQVSRHGHLDLYARLYSGCLLELGYAVTLIEQHDSGTKEWLERNNITGSENFTAVTRDGLRDKRQANGPGVSSLPIAGVPAWGERIGWGARGALSRWLPGAAKKVDGAVAALRRRRHKLRLYFQRVKSPERYTSGFNFEHIVDEIHMAVEFLGIRPTLVFFLYLDMMNEDEAGCRYLEERLGAPWAGILFHPRYTRKNGRAIERYLQCYNARGAAYLNPHFIPDYQRAFPDQLYCPVPDVTEAKMPRNTTEMATLMRAKADGRCIVLIVGTIAPHKGVLQLIEAIGHCNPVDFFFAMVGEVHWEHFGAQESTIREFYQTPPENCLVRAGYLEDERDLNAVIAAADIVYAVYNNFHDSSNSLTKASLMEKPILVSNEYLMGERVQKYRIGETVTPGDVKGIACKLELLRQAPRSSFGFAEYRRDNSVEALQGTLKKAVPRWIEGR